MEKLKKQPKFQLSQPSGVHTATWPNQWADKCATRASSLPLLLHARKARSLATSSVQGRVFFTAPVRKCALPTRPTARPLRSHPPIRAKLSARKCARLFPCSVKAVSLRPIRARHVSIPSKVANRHAPCGKPDVKFFRHGNQAQTPNLPI